MAKSVLVLFVMVAIGCGTEAAPDVVDDGSGGSDGAQGEVGPQGPQGPAGADGEDGSDGVDGQDGADGLDGADGSDGAQGPQGPTGPQGNDGVDGLNGQSTVVLDSSGNQIGFPAMIDRGANMTPAVFAHMDSPPATFPQDLLISATPLGIIFYTGGSCTGTPHMLASELSGTYGKNVGYVLGSTSDLYFPVTGTQVGSGGMSSFSTGSGCGNGGAAANLVVVAKSTKVFSMNKPWMIEHN